MAEQISELLRKNQLSVTDNRKKILELFLQSDSALAHHDIEARTKEKFDRVTVYRTLQTFMDRGIIHTIPTADNSVKYALCKDSCEQGHHHDDHVHFICSSCGTTTCLEEIHIPEIKLPRGYKTKQTEVVISGVCKLCS
ncbi:MAG: transcriptional repressor [Chitinophagaceae bacterium]|nr:transcriptional repressor [Chitinophagaceae bacterium]